MDTLLNETHVKVPLWEVLEKKPLISLVINKSIQDTLTNLSNNGVLSGPVVKVAGSQEPIAIVDVLDLVEFMFVAKKQAELASAEEAFQSPLSKLIEKDLHKRNPPSIINLNYSLKNAIELLSLGNHRLLVTNDQQVLVGMLSQTDVARFIATNIAYLELKVGQQKVQDLKVIKQGVPSITLTTKFEDAVKQLHTSGAFALPVLDETGKVIDSFALLDLKGAKKKDFALFMVSVGDFFKNKPRKAPVVIKPEFTLEHVLLKFVATKAHAIYVVDDGLKYNGVINLNELLAAFISH